MNRLPLLDLKISFVSAIHLWPSISTILIESAVTSIHKIKRKTHLYTQIQALQVQYLLRSYSEQALLRETRFLTAACVNYCDIQLLG